MTVICAQCKEPIEPWQAIRWLDEDYCHMCSENAPMFRNKIVAWIDSQPQTQYGYNLLKIMPKLIAPYDMCPECNEPALPVQTTYYADERGEIVRSETYLHFFGSKALLNRLKKPYKLGFWRRDVNKDLAHEIDVEIFANNHATVRVCSFYVEDTGKKTRQIENSTVCQKCGEIGRQTDIERGHGVYRYILHFDDLGDIRKRCYIQTVKSSKTPMQKCPKCHELGRKTVDKRGYVYFKHYSNSKRTTHYIGTQTNI